MTEYRCPADIELERKIGESPCPSIYCDCKRCRRITDLQASGGVFP